MNSQAYANGFTYHLQQWQAADPVQRQMLEPVLDYCEMRYWMELGKEMIIEGTAEQYRRFVDQIGCSKRAVKIAALVQMEKCGMVVTLDKYNSFMQMEVSGHDHQGHVTGDAG